MQKVSAPNLLTTAIGILLLIGGAVPAGCAADSAQDLRALERRIQGLEDREEIRQLLKGYGQFLDRRDFAAFAKLFADKDGEWIGGMGRARGSQAIQKLMEDKIGTGKAGLPNVHIFTNEIIDVNGDLARATTKWIFVVQGDGAKPQIVYIGHYEDTLTRENAHWKFLRRIVYGDIPPDNPLNKE